MKQLKHHKTRNTGFLYEVLVKQLTTDLLNNNFESKALKLIKKYFNEGKSLYEELALYNILLKTKDLQKDRANTLIDETIKARKKLDEKSLVRNKYELVKEIKDNFDLKGLFTSKIQNYVLLASIYKLFESELNNSSYNPINVVDSRYTIMESMGVSQEQHKDRKNNNNILSTFSQQDRTVKLLTLQNIIKNFNKRYENLSGKQKKLLKIYMNSLSDNSILENYLQEEVPKLQRKLKNVSVEDDVLRIKLDEISKRTIKLLNNH